MAKSEELHGEIVAEFGKKILLDSVKLIDLHLQKKFLWMNKSGETND